jgi:drug/metabolite transporter (DMT)-like permease
MDSNFIDPKIIGIGSALGSAASWAVGAILFKKLGESLSAFAMTLVKGAVSLLLMALVLLIVGFKIPDSRSVALLAFSGVLGIAFGDTFFFEALKELGPRVLVVLVLIGPVITIILAVLFLGETLKLITAVGILLVILGIGMVLFSSLSGENMVSRWRGIIFGLLSVLCMALSTIVAKVGFNAMETKKAPAASQSVAGVPATPAAPKGAAEMAANDPETLEASFIRMGAGTAAMFLFGLGTRRLGNWVLPFKDIRLGLRFITATCVVTFGGFWLSLVSIKYIDVTIANTLGSVEPLFMLPLAAIFLREKITFKAALGTLVAVAGIVTICLYQ